MIKVFNILSRTFCLLLMIHLLAMSVCDDYLLKLVNKSKIEKIIEVEKETDNNTKEKSFELKDSDDEYLLSFHNNLIPHCCFLMSENFMNPSFQYLQIALPQRINEILIPPPQV